MRTDEKDDRVVRQYGLHSRHHWLRCGPDLGDRTSQAPAEKKTDDKSMEKKPASQKKMTMEEKKAACLEKAGTDDAKKTKCEKQFTAKSTGKKAAAAGQAPAQTGEKK